MAGDTRIGDLIFEPKLSEQGYMQFFYEGNHSYNFMTKDDAKKIVQHLTDVFELEQE